MQQNPAVMIAHITDLIKHQIINYLASYKYAIIYTLKQEHNHMCVLKINLREDVGILSVCVCFCVENVLTGNR